MSTAKRIFLVDDEADLCEVVGNMLIGNGYSVRVCHSGPELINALRDELPTLILLDIMMPDMDGYQLCRIIKHNPKTQHVKVCFYSVLQEKEDLLKVNACGADAYINKKLPLHQLLKKLKTLL